MPGLTPVIMFDDDYDNYILAIIYVPKNDVEEVAKVIEKVKSEIDFWTTNDIKEAVSEHEGWYYEAENFASVGV